VFEGISEGFYFYALNVTCFSMLR